MTFGSSKVKLAVGVIASVACLWTPFSSAEVKSLTSSELTETYVKDSTIIIRPREAEGSTQSTVSTLTIAPVEGIEQDIEELQNYQIHEDAFFVSRELDDEILRNASVDFAVNPPPELQIASFRELNTPPVADILDDERFRVPVGDFDFDFVSNDLGLSRNGDQLTFSIGNLPGIDPIQIPEAVDEGPLQITPRPGGGFDLTINIPEPLQ